MASRVLPAAATSILLASATALAQAPGMPPGHPPTSGTATTASGTPGAARAPDDLAILDPGVPEGTIRVEIQDAQSNPISTKIRLGILKATVAEGNQREHRDASTDSNGRAEFTGLSTGSAFQYRVTVPRGPATYASDPIRLMGSSGYRVLLHVFPVTRNIKEALIGARGMTSVVPRDDVFQFETMFRISNVGTNTWVPQDVRMALPKGWKGFATEESASDVRFVKDGDRGVRLKGTITPGQHDASFSFQVPNDHEGTARFQLDTLPHVMQFRVLAPAVRGMSLEVEGFEPAVRSRGNGRPLLIADRGFRAGDTPLDRVTIAVSGLPARGTGRWWAVALAIAFVAAGLRTVRPSGSGISGTVSPGDAVAARERLLDELVELERARAEKRIGPKTFERARGALVEALSRVLALSGDGSEPAGSAKTTAKPAASDASRHPARRQKSGRKRRSASNVG